MSRYLSRPPSSRRRRAQWGLTALLAVTMAAAPGAAVAETASGWTDPEPVTAFPAQPDEDFPHAVMDVGPAGDAAAAWLVPRAAGGYRVNAAMRDESGTWTPTGPLSRRVREYVTFDLAVDRDGDTSVVWERWVDGAPQVELVHCEGTVCGAPEAVGVGGYADADVEVDRSGRAIVAWRRPGQVVVRMRTADGEWGTTRAYTAPEVWRHSLDVTPDGDAMLSWFEWRTQRTRAAVHRAGAGWPHPETLMEGVRAFRVSSLVDRRGRAMFVGQTSDEFDEVARRYLNGIVWTKLRADGTWAPMRNYNDDLGEDGTLQSIAMNVRGKGVAVWFAHRGDALRTEAARFTVAGRWGEPQRLSKTWSQNASWVGIDGVARVVFEQPKRTTTPIRYVEHEPGVGWTVPVQIGAGDITDGAGGRTRMVYTAVDGDETDGYRLWASTLDVTAD